jgi:hypothetical protein
MPTCPDREKLTIQYDEAVVIFSASVTCLRGRNGNGNGFAEAQHATELARLHAETARIMLAMHRAEHSC